MSNSYLSNKEIHYRYILLILIFIIIGLSSAVFLQSGKSALSHLNVASTVTSILLGLLAIVYAYLSNQSISSSIGNIEKSSQSLDKLTINLSEIEQSITSSVDRSENVDQQLSSTIEDLKEELKSVRDITKNLLEYTENISSVSSEIPQSMKLIQESLFHFHRYKSTESDKSYYSIITKCGLSLYKKLHISKEKVNLQEVLVNPRVRYILAGIMDALEFCEHAKFNFTSDDEGLYVDVLTFDLKVEFENEQLRIEIDEFKNEEEKEVIDCLEKIYEILIS